MTDSTEGMTPLQRAEALEVEAAQLIDRSIRRLPDGVTSEVSLKLVRLIVEAAAERISAAPTDDEARARAADRVEFNVGVHKATDG